MSQRCQLRIDTCDISVPTTRAGQIARYAEVRKRLQGTPAAPAGHMPVPVVRVPTPVMSTVVKTEAEPEAAPHVSPADAPPPRARDWMFLTSEDSAPVPGQVHVGTIMETVADHFLVSVLDLISHRRTRAVILPRQVAMYLAATLTGYSLPRIARLMGGRDHTTILHGMRKVNALIEGDRRFAMEVDGLRRKLLAVPS